MNLWGELEHTPEYRKVLSSTVWKKLKTGIVRQRGRKCERCGLAYFIENLQLHHKHYRTLGQESVADVELLCRNCHAKADVERMRQTASNNETALWNALLDGWASKVYGDDWGDGRVDPYEAEREFDDWLERQL